MNLKLVIALVALSLPLAACGNKGRLVLPPAPPTDVPVVEPPAATEPTDPTESDPPAEILPPEAAEPASTSPPPMPPDDEDGDG